MGYCIELEEGKIKLTEENMKKALKELSGKNFCWCDSFDYEDIDFSNNDEATEDNYDKISVYDVWEGLRYYIDFKNNYWVIHEFEGEKLGDDEDIFRTIAPYCEDGYLQYLGEDGERWRYIIKDGKFDIKYAEIKWE